MKLGRKGGKENEGREERRKEGIKERRRGEAGKEEEPVQRWVTEPSPSNGYRLLDSMESSSHYMKYSTEISVQGKRRSLHLLASSNHGP